jgi:hypothetical protein
MTPSSPPSEIPHILRKGKALLFVDDNHMDLHSKGKKV